MGRSRIRFWKDTWCDESPLCEGFSALNSLAVAKGAKVADIWDNSMGDGAWNPTFVRPFNDWEIEEV